MAAPRKGASFRAAGRSRGRDTTDVLLRDEDGWLERAGPREAGVVLPLGALGVYAHQLWLLWLGSGVIGGIGLGLGYSVSGGHGKRGPSGREETVPARDHDDAMGLLGRPYTRPRSSSILGSTSQFRNALDQFSTAPKYAQCRYQLSESLDLA